MWMGSGSRAFGVGHEVGHEVLESPGINCLICDCLIFLRLPYGQDTVVKGLKNLPLNPQKDTPFK